MKKNCEKSKYITGGENVSSDTTMTPLVVAASATQRKGPSDQVSSVSTTTITPTTTQSSTNNHRQQDLDISGVSNTSDLAGDASYTSTVSYSKLKKLYIQ